MLLLQKPLIFVDWKSLQEFSFLLRLDLIISFKAIFFIKHFIDLQFHVKNDVVFLDAVKTARCFVFVPNMLLSLWFSTLSSVLGLNINRIYFTKVYITQNWFVNFNPVFYYIRVERVCQKLNAMIYFYLLINISILTWALNTVGLFDLNSTMTESLQHRWLNRSCCVNQSGSCEQVCQRQRVYLRQRLSRHRVCRPQL